ncbi:MAG: COG4315 family predicted lipoprotein [Dehalococcoidia bacterium]
MRGMVVLGLCLGTLLTACGSNNSKPSSSAGPAASAAPANLVASTTSVPSGRGGGADYGYGAPAAAASATAAVSQAARADAGAVGGVTVAATAVTPVGTVLVAANGRPLYRFDRDASGTSACKGACATTWPPLALNSAQPAAGSGVGGTLATITRADGARQVTYNGAPLYTYSGDTAPGQAAGDGIGGIWHVAKP